MDLNQVMSALKTIGEGQKDDSLGRLFGDFQELIQLQLDYQSMMSKKEPLSKEELRSVFEKMKGSLEKLQENYGEFCKKIGKSPEELKNYFSDPKNFTPKVWEEIQGLGRKFGLEEKESAPSSDKKEGESKKWLSI